MAVESTLRVFEPLPASSQPHGLFAAGSGGNMLS